jgi:hypothetical protein
VSGCCHNERVQNGGRRAGAGERRDYSISQVGRSIAERPSPRQNAAKRENGMNNLKKAQEEMRARQSEPAPTEWYTVSMISRKWKMSPETASLILQKYRGRQGFMDAGSHGDTKRHTRARAIIRISPQLLEIIERDLQK